MVEDALARLKRTSAIRSIEGPEPGFWISEDDYRDMQAVISAYMEDERFTAIIKLIAQHHHAHPDHGIDCACMDVCIQKFRQMTAVGFCQQRIDYVIGKALDR